MLLSFALKAQNLDTLDEEASNKTLGLSGGIDVYYAYDFTAPMGNKRLYTTQAYKHNEFNLNWGFIKADYAVDQVRGTFALQTGTYVQANYAAESNELTQLIAQANVGVRVLNNTWLDVGILPSHIGYESTFSFNNEIYTRALMAENSPYYEAGAQVTTAVSDKITAKVLVLNGWQNIHETNQAKSIGFGISYVPSNKLSLSYSNYYGNEAPDSLKAKRRFFHSMHAKYTITDKLTLATCVDYGRQEQLGSNNKAQWFAGMIISRYQISPIFAIAGRAEHYNDPSQLIVFTNTPNGFQTSSASLNIDYKPAEQFLWRLEIRGYVSRDKVFFGKEGSQDDNLLIVSSMSIKL
jgi:hypothetical protein